MFKCGSTEKELMQEMEKHLITKQAEDQRGFNKLATALDYLSAAANIFDKSGMHKEAEDITNILQSFADKNSFEEESGFDISDLFNTVKSVSAEDIKNVISASPIVMSIKLIAAIIKKAKEVKDDGVVSMMHNLKKEYDLSDKKVLDEYKDIIASKLSTAIKALKIAAMVG